MQWSNGNLLPKDLGQHTTAPRTAVVSAPDPAAGHCQPTPLPEMPRHSQVSLAQSLAESLLLPPGSWFAPKVLLWPPRVCFPGGAPSFCRIPRLGNLLWALELLQQCENFFGIIVLQFMGRLLGGCMVGLMMTSCKRTYASCQAAQVCCSQSPCPHRGHCWPVPLQETLKLSNAV